MKIAHTESTHSDFLIHWTGIDIDRELDPNWNPECRSAKLPNDAILQYLQRLKSTLRHGMWMMMRRNGDDILKINDQKFKKPSVARTCFTELKLSEARKHAGRFGRLGFGVKRCYLFDRLGAPMKYVQSGTHNLSFPPYSDRCIDGGKDHELLSFYKHMCSKRPWTYDLFSESEWRIIYSESIKAILKEKSPNRLLRFVDPCDDCSDELREFFDQLQGEKPEYLLPLDAWLSMIIYPSPEVKNAAFADEEVRSLIKKVKATHPVTGCPQYEFEMWPIEVDLDACSHF